MRRFFLVIAGFGAHYDLHTELCLLSHAVGLVDICDFNRRVGAWTWYSLDARRHSIEASFLGHVVCRTLANLRR